MRYFASAVLLWIATPALADDINYDFRNSGFNDKLFQKEGPTPDQFMRFEEEGLHWRFIAGQAPTRPVGIYWNFRVHGNFVATARYQILEADQPTRGYGNGAEMYLMLDNPSKDGIGFSRVLRPEGPFLQYSHMTTNEEGKRTQKDSQHFPTTSRSERGRLRLAREGPTLIASFAEEDQELVEIYRADIGEMSIRMVRFAGISGGDPNVGLDMRLLEYQIEAQDLPEAPAPADSHSWLSWLLVVAVLIFMTGYLLFLYFKPKTKTSAEQTSPPAKPLGLPGGSARTGIAKGNPPPHPGKPRSRED